MPSKAPSKFSSSSKIESYFQVMANLTELMVEFAMSLPPSTNPYEATAVIIRKETQTAKPALWAVILRRIIAFHYLVLCGQAITALWLRKKADKLHFFRYNKLGLIHVEVLNEIVLLMFAFSLVFVWILCIETAMDLTSLGARARAGASIRLSPYTRFMINSLLLAVIAVPSAMVLGISILRATILAAIEATSEEVIASLRKSASTYRPGSDNYSNLVEILKPTESISPNSP
ncbi:hypothetical protein PCANC_07223 [Puccinia coronata f. sp. avenae]|uniref:Uncharacterized protein n=1 Tax=Puccinia coronata f. sp. avenae TaxID=200324 RepID=A0A2N5VU64_9BASI|nr:hypothetical protein PCANC_07223 [Puccinia coronata f. sp. avenae]